MNLRAKLLTESSKPGECAVRSHIKQTIKWNGTKPKTERTTLIVWKNELFYGVFFFVRDGSAKQMIHSIWKKNQNKCDERKKEFEKANAPQNNKIMLHSHAIVTERVSTLLFIWVNVLHIDVTEIHVRLSLGATLLFVWRKNWNKSFSLPILELYSTLCRHSSRLICIYVALVRSSLITITYFE